MLPRLNEFYETLLLNGRCERTAKTKIIYCRYFAKWYGSDNLKKVSRADIQRYKVYLMTEHKTRYWGKRLADSSIANRLYDTQLYFRFLQERKEIFFDPTLGLTIPKVKKFGAIKYLTEAEMQELIQKPDTATDLGVRDRLIFELFYTAALRCSELCRLKISEINMRKKYIYPSRSKGGRECEIPILPSTYKTLKKYLTSSRPELLKRSGKPDDPEELFITRRGTRCTTGGIEQMFVKYRGDNKNMHPHAVRHSCAVHLRKNGADPRDIQVLLGHNSLESTQVYTELAMNHSQDVLDKYHPREKCLKTRSLEKIMKPNPFKDWCLAPDFAKQCGVTTRAIYDAIEAQKIEAWLVGEFYLINKDQIPVYLSTRRAYRRAAKNESRMACFSGANLNPSKAEGSS